MTVSHCTILLLSAARLLEYMTKLNILGYLTQTLFKFDVPEKDLGTYQALIYNIHAVGLALGNLIYGLLLDHFSTKHVLSLACLNVGLASLVFGFSTGPQSMLILRFFLGALDGIEVSVRVYVDELVIGDRALVWIYAAPLSMAIALAPVLGGVLALPVQQYPLSFHDSYILDFMPILLPNALLGFLLLVLSFTGYYLLPAIKHRSLKNKHVAKGKYAPLCADKDLQETDISIMTDTKHETVFVALMEYLTPKPATIDRVKSLLHRDFVLASMSMMCFCAGVNTFFTLFALWIGSPVELAGKGYSPLETVHIYFWPGLIAMVCDLIIVGSVNTRLRPRRSFALWSILKMVSICLIIPSGSIKNRLMFNVVTTLGLTVIRTCTSGCNAAGVSLVNNTAPSYMLGIANASAMSFSALSQIAITTIMCKIYIWSLSNELSRQKDAWGFPFNHYFAFYLTSIITGIAGVSSVCMSKNIDR